MDGVLDAGSTWVESLFLHAPVGQGLVDLEGRWIRVNPALARMLDRDADELTGMTVLEVTHPDDVELSREYGDRLLRGEIARYQIEKRYLRPDGSVVWGRLTCALARDELGEPRYGVAQVEDVTAERANRRFTEAIVEHTGALVVVFDRDGRIVRWNRACEHHTGYAADEVVGVPFWETPVVAEADRMHAERLFRALVEYDGPPVTTAYDVTWMTRQGSPIALRWSGALLRDDSDQVTHMVGTGIDVTEQYTAQQALSLSERRHRAIVERSSDLIVMLDELGTLVYASGAAERLLGKRSEDILGTHALSHVHPDDLDHAAEELLEAMATPTPGAPTQVRLLHADGSAVAIEALATNLLDDPAVGGVVVALRDVREREDLDRRFRSAFDAAPIGMAIVALDGTYLDVNGALCEITGYGPEAMLGLRFQDITHTDDLEAGHDLVQRLLTGQVATHRIETRYVRADGDLVWAQLSVTLVRDDSGEPAYFICQVEDVTDRKAATDGLAHQAHHDSLTGLLNRHAALRRLDQALSRRHAGGVALLFIDLDGFKEVNDTYGHAVGDEVLRAVSARLAMVLRPTDAAGRLGGDEFVVVLEGADLRRADGVAARLHRAVANPVPLPDGGWVQVRASIGIAVATADEPDASTLLRRADEAMYAAKRRAATRA